MDRLIKFVLTVSMLIPGMAFAAGYHLTGYVDVFSYSTYAVMQGNMSVRFNTTAPGSPYIYATGYAGSTVSFHGRDSDNEYFSCYVFTSSPLYQAAVDIKNNLQDGSRLYVTRNLDSNECSNVFLGNYSYMQQ